MPCRTDRIPKHCRHKRSGRGYVTLDGRPLPTGDFGTPEAEAAYRDFLARWLNGELLGSRGEAGPSALLIRDLVAQYWTFAESRYSVAGRPTGELANVRYALRFLLASAGFLPVADFGPLRLKAFQAELAKKDLCRSVVNKIVNYVRRMFRWATSEEIVPPSTYHALQAVEPFRRGDGRVRETDRVGPVAEAHVFAVLPHVQPAVRAMILLQWFTGMRPGEVRCMRGFEVDRTVPGLWCYQPSQHKTSCHGQERRIWLGPQAQAVLRPLLAAPPRAPLFSPRSAERRPHQLRMSAVRSEIASGERCGSRKGTLDREAGCYSAGSYGRAIARACLQAGVPVWSPNQLRHAAATRIQATFGVEAAQHCLGHTNLKTTEIYAERNHSLAQRAMRELG